MATATTRRMSAHHDSPKGKAEGMMHDGGMMGGMMWGMGLVWLLVIILLVLGVAALLKYLFSRR